MLLQSFLDVPVTSHFPLQNLPYGIFSTKLQPRKRVGVALGSSVIDLAALGDVGLFNGPHLQHTSCFHEVRSETVQQFVFLLYEPSAFCPCYLQATLNGFMALGRKAWTEARETLTTLLSADESVLRDNKELLKAVVMPEVKAKQAALMLLCTSCVATCCLLT